MEEQIFSNSSVEETERAADLENNSEALAEESYDTSDTVAVDVSSTDADRREYEELIRTKYKKFYTEDTQKMINRRFRKYKELEAHADMLEEKISQFDALLKAEKEKSAREAEQRIIAGLRARHSRPEENGIFVSKNQAKRDVASLTRSERADMARRVSKGEIIKI